MTNRAPIEQAANLKRHFIGKTYELTQENMKWLISQLEGAQAKVRQDEKRVKRLEIELEVLQKAFSSLAENLKVQRSSLDV